MVIKDDNKPFKPFVLKLNLKELITGCPNNKQIGLFLMGTVLLWAVGIIINSILFFISADPNIIYIDKLLTILVIFGSIGVGLAFISLIAVNDWESYGKNIWFRVVGYNIILILISLYIMKDYQESQIIEPVKSMVFIKSDNGKCANSIKLTSENMQYVYCESSSSTFEKLQETPNLNMTIVGTKKYGKLLPINMEIIEKTVTLK